MQKGIKKQKEKDFVDPFWVVGEGFSLVLQFLRYEIEKKNYSRQRFTVKKALLFIFEVWIMEKDPWLKFNEKKEENHHLL